VCNCMKEMEQKLIEKAECEEADGPVELLSGRAYITFTVRKIGKKKEEKIPVMLSRCPFCGKEYETN
jgi:hypothetical protein